MLKRQEKKNKILLCQLRKVKHVGFRQNHRVYITVYTGNKGHRHPIEIEVSVCMWCGDYKSDSAGKTVITKCSKKIQCICDYGHVGYAHPITKYNMKTRYSAGFCYRKLPY